MSTERRRRLADARLYLVCDARPGGAPAEPLLRAALAGGVDVVQLRDKQLDDCSLLGAATTFRRLCEEHGALFLVNDRPDLAVTAGADGVHVGQGDMPVQGARRVVGPDRLVGLSTHTPEEVDEAAGVDYIGVGPVHVTPTKPGRAPTGPSLVEHAARCARVPFFAIGGIDTGNVGEVVSAGATRIAVVRAIAEAGDPEAAARRLRAALPEEARVGAP